MDYLAPPLSALIGELEKLPTIGPKTAARLAFYLLSASRADTAALSRAILDVKDKVRFCSRCYSLTEQDPCALCSDPKRDASVVCVVGEAKDVYAIERTMSYRGRYHVLGGLISPIEGVGVGQLKIKELIDRISAEGIAEIIVATNPNAEGESTALYLARLLTPSGVKVTRLAYGLPIGGDLDYADEVTVARALEGRRTL
ncbi:MAG: recombination protein RecR [Candidatus Eremiobacter antarcticus]|nr:recombination protein RecR [Candidatus Eremiobacteraeota bacterium]MBC5808146.1 recombination protein RecR [Candidatus Eremiobacteraeota bacterium]PZR63541.1 MAG: recombination protein RecR [Candidatus Eremiobacter sp. RRmetagenome_bin22]